MLAVRITYFLGKMRNNPRLKKSHTKAPTIIQLLLNVKDCFRVSIPNVSETKQSAVAMGPKTPTIDLISMAWYLAWVDNLAKPENKRLSSDK